MKVLLASKAAQSQSTSETRLRDSTSTRVVLPVICYKIIVAIATAMGQARVKPSEDGR